MRVAVVVLVLVALRMEQQDAAEEHEREEADRDEERHRRRRVAPGRQVERLRQQIEEGDAEDRARAEPEDQVQLVTVLQGEAAAEERRQERREAEREGHAAILARARV